jgi:LuxR family maltose regulon positive regulatory protein
LTAVRARLELVEGRPWEALEATEPAFAGTLSAIHPAVAIELAVLDALARRELRHRDGMVASLERALNLAAPEGYRRPFLGAGAACRAALEDYASGSVAHGALAVELIALLDSRLPDGARSRAQLLEPLSARERAILRYLPTMMSNQEIAGELFVSVNTVKTHLRHVYRKLGVAKRREAVDAARRLDLL